MKMFKGHCQYLQSFIWFLVQCISLYFRRVDNVHRFLIQKKVLKKPSTYVSFTHYIILFPPPFQTPSGRRPPDAPGHPHLPGPGRPHPGGLVGRLHLRVRRQGLPGRRGGVPAHPGHHQAAG